MWEKLFLANFAFIFLLNILLCGGDEYEDKVEFVVHNGASKFLSFFNNSMVNLGCIKTGNFSIISHGWLGSTAKWIPELVKNLQTYRGGCVIFMNYSSYSDVPNYLNLYSHFKPLSRLLVRKLNQMKSDGVEGDRIFMFGFSFGGRIVIDAGIDYGTGLIDKIDSKI